MTGYIEAQVFNLFVLSSSYLETLRLTTKLCHDSVSKETIELLKVKFVVDYEKCEDQGFIEYISDKSNYITYIRFLAKLSISKNILYKEISELPKWYFTDVCSENFPLYIDFMDGDINITLMLLNRAIKNDIMTESLVTDFIFFTSKNDSWETKEQLENSLKLLNYLFEKGFYKEITSYPYNGIYDAIGLIDISGDGNGKNIMETLFDSIFDVMHRADKAYIINN